MPTPPQPMAQGDVKERPFDQTLFQDVMTLPRRACNASICSSPPSSVCVLQLQA